MATTLDNTVPSLSGLPTSMPREGAIELELQQGVLILNVSEAVQARIEALIDKQRAGILSPPEVLELSQYEEVDDYLSFLNRLIRNLAQAEPPERDLAS
jgi:hypothetical protein